MALVASAAVDESVAGLAGVGRWRREERGEERLDTLKLCRQLSDLHLECLQRCAIRRDNIVHVQTMRHV